MGVVYQILGAGVISYICMSSGLMFTWPSSTYLLFESLNTTLNRPMTESELSLVSSLPSLGAIIGTPVAGYYLDVYGRKYCAIISTLFHVIAWAMIIASDRVEIIITSMFISGIGGAVLLIVPIYVSEICQESIRGTLVACGMIFYTLGILTSFLLGGLLEYKLMNYIGLTISVVGVMMLWMIKDSPMYLLQKGNDEEAAKSLAFYRSIKPNSKEVLREMNAMRRVLNTDPDASYEPVTPEEEMLKPITNPVEAKEKLSLWQFIKRSRSTRQAIFVILTLVTTSIFQGHVVVQVYVEPLFAEVVPNMPTLVNSLVFNLITLVFGLVTAFLLEKAGRRPLMIYASIGSGLCCIIIGTQLQLHWAPHWMTAALIFLFCIVYTFGAGTVPYILAPEYFLPEVKAFMTMLILEWIFICYFVILLIFNPLVGAIGLGAVFYIFAAFCFLTAAFSAVYQPETKGLSIAEIQALFVRKRGRKH